ncbi:TolC family outer membrane protein [Sinimarinibacterium thermocellulolyticum]|uniref:TolC family outer membrane protein n=1 Tax=Sinimarinibacterium thermocellulolyticum TaxID=3170016 RepID=A0ABV2A9Z3_9GAMM
MTCVLRTERAASGRWQLAALGLLLALSPAVQAELLFSDALQRAAERDPAYAAAFAAQRADREAGEQERARLRPSLSLSGSGSFVASDSRFAFGAERDEYPVWSARLEARQPVLRLDWSARRQRADARDALADARFQQAQTDFVVRVAQRYLEAMRAQDQLRLMQAEVEAVRRSLDDVRKRYEVELVPGTDLKEAQARYDLARAELIRAEAELEWRLDALAELTGPFDAPLPRLAPALAPPPLPATSIDDWLALLEDNNATLRIAALDVEIAKADHRSRKAEAQPQADLVASAGRADASASELGSLQDEARVGVELVIPIYAGGINHSRVREAEARLEATRLIHERLLAEARREVRTQFRNFEVARISVDALTAGLESARSAEQAVMAGYDAGTRTIADVLDARRRVAEAERNLNQARYDLLTTIVLLQASAGTLDAEDLVALDALLEVPRS